MLESETLRAVLVLVLAYLIGSVSFGVVVSRALGRDVRQKDFPGGSGMIRQFGWGVGLSVIALDIAKGALAAWIASVSVPNIVWYVPVAVAIGHCWPIWHGFQGGQGLAPMGGAVLYLDWFTMLVPLALGVMLIAVHRVLNLRQVVKLASVPFGALFGMVLMLYLSWVRNGQILPIILVLIVLIVRGVQVLRSPSPGGSAV
jgi:acyl-phosphate glycerol 3-phosphate acyltransferase